MMIVRSTDGMRRATPKPRSVSPDFTCSTIGPSSTPRPSSVSTTIPPPSDVAVVVTTRCAPRTAVVHVFAKASDSTMPVTAFCTRLRSPSAAGWRRRSSASAARRGRPRPATPSMTLPVICSKSAFCSIAAMVWSITSCWTEGSCASGPSIATKRSSSTSSARAHAATIETGTRTAATMMQRADRGARHQLRLGRPPLFATASVADDPVAATRRAFSASSSRTRCSSSPDGSPVMSGTGRRLSLVCRAPFCTGPAVSRGGFCGRPTLGRGLRWRGGWRRPCRGRPRRRRGSARRPSCGGAARCDRRAGGTSSRSPRRRASLPRCRRCRRSPASG